MSSLRAIMDEIGAKLDAVVGQAVIGERGAQVVPRFNLNPSGLSIDVYPAPEFRTTDTAGFGDINGALIFTVRARTDFADLDSSQDAILDMMDDEHDLCVALALLEDQTLNGFATSVEVDGPTGFLPYGDNPGTMLGVEWKVTILAART